MVNDGDDGDRLLGDYYDDDGDDEDDGDEGNVENCNVENSIRFLCEFYAFLG